MQEVPTNGECADCQHGAFSTLLYLSAVLWQSSKVDAPTIISRGQPDSDRYECSCRALLVLVEPTAVSTISIVSTRSESTCDALVRTSR